MAIRQRIPDPPSEDATHWASGITASYRRRTSGGRGALRLTLWPPNSGRSLRPRRQHRLPPLGQRERSLDEAVEQRMRLLRPRLELGMELRREEVGMVVELHDLDEPAVR